MFSDFYGDFMGGGGVQEHLFFVKKNYFDINYPSMPLPFCLVNLSFETKFLQSKLHNAFNKTTRTVKNFLQYRIIPSRDILVGFFPLLFAVASEARSDFSL